MTVIGFRVNIDGVMRVFHDTKAVTFLMARNLKSKHKQSKIEIIDEASGRAVEMLQDGRTA
jgi:hypothetical protein